MDQSPETESDGLLRCYAVGRYTRAGAADMLRAAGLPKEDAESRAFSLPDRFPFVFPVETGVPILSVLLYLLRRWSHPKAGMEGPRSLNSARAQAYDICDFLEHLDAYGLGYESIDQDIFDKFAEDQAKTPSAATGRLLTRKTISRRLAHVATFLNSKEFQTMGNASVERKLAPLGGRIDQPEIHPLSVDEWRALTPLLGPLPSERQRGQSSVLRLISEWAVLTGARRIELAHLRVEQIEEAIADPGLGRLTLEVTKGGVPRPLWLHPDAIAESATYLRTERAEAVSRTGLPDHGYLFVNPLTSGGAAGRAVRPDTITTWFRNAVSEAQLLRRTIGAGAGPNPFTFHDLRHTFAVWTYVALDLAGRKRPWKIIQSRLGHKHLETTESVYLAYVEDHEIEISNLLRDHLANWDLSDHETG